MGKKVEASREDHNEQDLMKEKAEHVNLWIQAMPDQIKKEYNKVSHLQWEREQLFPTFCDLCATPKDGSTRQTVKEDLELMCRVLKQQIDTTVGEGVVDLRKLRMKVKDWRKFEEDEKKKDAKNLSEAARRRWRRKRRMWNAEDC